MSFDITNFLITPTSKPNPKKVQFAFKLSQLMRDQKIFLVEYTYFKEFEKDNGTICNVGWVLEILSRINDQEFNEIILFNFPHIFFLDTTGNISIKMDQIINSLTCQLDFTGDQKSAIGNILNFLINKNMGSFGLFGYAGTGKTTTIVELSYYLLSNNYLRSIVFSAPTNKAVNVIKVKFRPYLKMLCKKIINIDLKDDFKFEDGICLLSKSFCKIEFITIHKLLKFKVAYSSDGDRVFMRNKNSIIDKFELVIIDECSMIPLNIVDQLLSEIKKKVFSSGDNFKKVPKILFCGDPAQLPPVEESFSTLFMGQHNVISLSKYKKLLISETINKFMTNWTDEELEARYKIFTEELSNIKNVTLKEVVRSKIMNVTKVCYEIRRWVNKEIKFPDLSKYNDKHGITFYEYDNTSSKLLTNFFKKCLAKIRNENSMSIILTWTNVQACSYNDEIRKKVFNRDNKDNKGNIGGIKKLDRFVVGDVLMLSDFYNMRDDNSQGKPSSVQFKGFYTSDQIKVKECKLIEKDFGVFDTIFSDGSKDLKDYDYIYKKISPVCSLINEKTSRRYKCWELMVQKISEGISEGLKNNYSVIYVIEDSELEKLESDKEFASTQIKKIRNQLVNALKGKEQTIDNYFTNSLWEKWFNIFVDSFANVNYGYAISCHKAQGSNFYNVFVDGHDIFKNTNENEMKRCFYTAVTRTSNKLYILF